MEDKEFNGETVENQEGVEVPAVDSSPVVDTGSEVVEGTEGEALEPVEETEGGSDAQPGESEADSQEELDGEADGKQEEAEIPVEDIGGEAVEETDGEVLEPSGQGDEIEENLQEELIEEPDEIYSLENPMPVQIIEPVEEEYELEVYSLSGSYPGVISDTYLNYFRGIVQKLDWKEHYVVYRSGQYSYTMVYGEEVALSGSRFTGSGNVVNIHRNTSSSSSDWYVSYSTDTLALSAGTLFVYSDLGMYPELKEGGTSLEFSALLFAVGFAVVYSVCHDIFDYIMEHVYRR